MVAKYVPPHLRNRQAEGGGGGGLNGFGEERGGELGSACRSLVEQDPPPRGSEGGGGGFARGPGPGGGGRRKGGDRQPPPSEGQGRFDCLKASFGGKGGRDTDHSSGGYGGRAGDRGERSKGNGNNYDHGGNGDSWFYRKDGRRPNGWDTPSEQAVFGDRIRTGINFDEYDKIPVQMSGSDCDAVVKIEWFSEAQLSEALHRNLDRCGYEKPTPVQKHSIPMVCDGRDVMACAQTGSGKTCAFMVPAIECLLRSGPPPPAPPTGRRPTPMPCALVMAPTRELTSQIFDEGRKFAYNTGIRCCVVYGGADMREQRRELNNGCDVLVATPGRLNDMYERGLLSLSLIQFLIFDEADRMLDMGFEPQVRQIVERTDMGEGTTRTRQSMMFSATFPREVQMMAADFLRDYVFLTVGRVGSASELVEQHVVYSDEREKVRILGQTLEDFLPQDGLALVFVETKRGADMLERDLYHHGACRGVTTIHGDRSQTERERALQDFRTGRRPVLIATDVASRGLDIPNVHLVVNFDVPKSIDDYVHRIGRTGRAGNRGKAVAFVNEKTGGPLLRDLRDNLLEANQEMPSWFEDLCRSTRHGGGGGGGYRGRKGGGGHRFGGHDMRKEFGGARSGGGGNWRGGGGREA